MVTHINELKGGEGGKGERKKRKIEKNWISGSLLVVGKKRKVKVYSGR